MRRSVLLALAGGLPLTMGLGFWSCSGTQSEPLSSHGILTPLDVKAPAEHAENGGAAETEIDIERLSPFLDQARFSSVREAYWDGDFEAACDAFEAALGSALTSRTLDAESWFQLGHLRAKAARHAPSAEAFEESSKSEWLLASYGRYLGARAYLDAGRPVDALRLLNAVPNEAAFTQSAELMRAELLLAQGESTQGIAALRQLLASNERPLDWSRAALLLSRALVEAGNAKQDSEEAVEALGWARKVSLQLAGTSSADEATELEQKILGRLSEQAFAEHHPLTLEQQLVRLDALLNQRQHDEALLAAEELLASAKAYSDVDCEARLLKAKALAAQRKWGKAVDLLEEPRKRCQGEDLRARLHFVAGKFAQYDKRYSHAIRIFAQLEREAKTHRLADDARIRHAASYLELGDEARFTELLSTITEDYPEGDVALDGLFDLVVRQVERNDWGQAANVLERAIPKAATEDLQRDHEFAGRERYFRARALIALGEQEQGLAEYEALIRDCPLSYYMLHAYSRLVHEDRARAEAALTSALTATEQRPFVFAHRPAFDSDAFRRALELARQGEIEWAEREIATLDGANQPELLWTVAFLYDRAGAASRSHELARGRLTDWLRHYPVGEWKKAWEVAFPRPFLPIVQRMSEKHDVPEQLIYAVMREESAFRADVVSHADAYGLMQLIKPTAKHFAEKQHLPYSEAALKRPSVNIALGAAVLSNYKTYFPNDPLLAIPGYNAGPGRPKRWRKERPAVDFDVWVELIPFNETRRYTKRVLASRGAYTFLYQTTDAEALLLPLKLTSP